LRYSPFFLHFAGLAPFIYPALLLQARLCLPVPCFSLPCCCSSALRALYLSLGPKCLFLFVFCFGRYDDAALPFFFFFSLLFALQTCGAALSLLFFLPFVFLPLPAYPPARFY
jgi:hypothetical protein